MIITTEIAIIDDGINSGYYATGELVRDLAVTDGLAVVPRSQHAQKLPSHGTTCAGIIRKYAPSARFGSIKILSDDTGTADCGRLIAALDYCRRERIPLVHMSLGTICMRDFAAITDAVEQLTAQGTIVVAACSNRGKYTLPAGLPEVFGVKCAPELEGRALCLNPSPLFDVPFCASARHLLTNCGGEERETPACNSYAAPLLTAEIVRLMEAGRATREDILRELLRRCGASVREGKRFHEYRARAGDFLGTEKELCRPDSAGGGNPAPKMELPVIVFDGVNPAVVSGVEQAFLREGYAALLTSSARQEALRALEGYAGVIPSGGILNLEAERKNIDLILWVSSGGIQEPNADVVISEAPGGFLLRGEEGRTVAVRGPEEIAAALKNFFDCEESASDESVRE